ncbi:MAG: histidine kinase [Bacteroidota bacterium]
MRTTGIFSVLFIWISLNLVGQAIPDLRQIQIGESFELEVLIEKKNDQRKEDGSLFYTRREQEIFYYSLTLASASEGIYTFKTSIDRFRSRYELNYNEERDKKRGEHRSYDSEFDVPGYPDRSEYEFLKREFALQVYPEKFNHQILFSPNDQYLKSYLSTALNPQGVSNHISAIFFVKSQPIKNGSISARLIPPRLTQKVQIKGKVEHPYSDLVLFSAKPGFGTLSNLSPFDRRIKLNEQGEFTLDYELKEGRFIFLFHHDPGLYEGSRKPQLSFPLYIEPGDEIELTIDGQNPDSLKFSGKSAAKFQAFHRFEMKYLGSNQDFWQRIVPFPGVTYRLNNLEYFTPPQQDIASLELQYQAILANLERQRNDLGERLYQRMKAESIYSFARRKLASGGDFPNYFNLDMLNNKGLTLSHNKDYYLDSMGLSLDAVIESNSYKDFLRDHLMANIQTLISKDIVKLPGRMQSYHFARFGYRDFALLTLLKTIILRDLKNSSVSLDRGEGYLKGIDEELDIIIQDFKAVCNYQPYLNEINNELKRINSLQKGQIAPDIQISDNVRLSDYLGEKVILVLFRELDASVLDSFWKAKKEHPELKFVFLYSNPLQEGLGYGIEVKDLPGELYESPGYGKSEARPFYYSGFRDQIFYLIDQNGKLWGTEFSKIYLNSLEKELKELVAYNPNPLKELFEKRRKTILQIFWWVSGIFNLYLLYVLLYQRPKRKREKLKAERIETELRAIRSQMNPHFLFNSLSSVQNLINQAEPERANYYLSRFSQLVRKVLNHSEQAMVPLADELKVVDLYCELEALRFKFEYQIEIDPNIDAQLTEVPSMVIQPYVENAVRHGIAMQAGSGRIDISVKEESGFISIEVEDNGMGIRKHMEEVAGKTEKSGFGLRLAEGRITKINERYNMNIGVAIYDRRDDQLASHGTRVVIQIPLES